MGAADPHGDEPLLILGAGLAGLSLACALLEEGVRRRPIVLLDRRTRWERDRTWCTWDTRPTRFTHLADARWHRWRTVVDGREAISTATRHPYLHLDSSRVYRQALEQLQAADNVELCPGERVLAIDCDGDRAWVRTDARTLSSTAVFDALGGGSPLLRGGPHGEIELAQRFLGWEVEVDRSAFDPSTATLMDFRAASEEGARFLYVLPFSSTRALIEDTSIGGRPLAAEARRAALAAELSDRLGTREWRIRHEEQGQIPMTIRHFPLHHGPHVHAVGTAGGAVRPSSGYAFSRIQAHCDQVARAVARGSPLPEHISSMRLAALDRIFLTVLEQEPARAPALFLRLAERVPGDVLARFMTDVSTPADEARIMAALPKLEFIAAALRVRPPAPAR